MFGLRLAQLLRGMVDVNRVGFRAMTCAIEVESTCLTKLVAFCNGPMDNIGLANIARYDEMSMLSLSTVTRAAFLFGKVLRPHSRLIQDPV